MVGPIATTCLCLLDRAGQEARDPADTRDSDHGTAGRGTPATLTICRRLGCGAADLPGAERLWEVGLLPTDSWTCRLFGQPFRSPRATPRLPGPVTRRAGPRQPRPYGRSGWWALISMRRLYLATRSPRAGAPVLSWPHPVPTARSAMNGSGVSPERWETICAYPARWQMAMASRVSVTVPIWFSLIRAALPMPSAMAVVMMAGLVQKLSSPTSCTCPPSRAVSSFQPLRSDSPRPSSMLQIG